MSGTDLALRPEEQAVHGLELAERVFTPERRQAIARFLNVSADEPALLPYLAISASYGLDPVMGQIWLIPQRVKIRDGDADKYVDRYRPAVGRDGYLAIARRDARYGGMSGAVVCEHDSFEVAYEGKPDDPKVLHRFAGKPTSFEAGVNPARWRGRVLGAWGKAFIKGQPPMFYFAPIHEHVRMRQKWEGKGRDRHPVVDASGRPVLEPEGAWSYVSTMILKACQSYVLRIGFGITGLVPVDEIPEGAIAGTAVEDEPDEFDWDAFDAAPAGLVGELRDLVEEANELSPLSWPPAKLEMVLSGRSEPELAEIRDRIRGEVENMRASQALRAAESRSEGEQGGSASEPVAPAEGGRMAEGPIQDAQVVGDDEPEVLGEHVAGLEARLGRLEERIAGVAPDTREFSDLSAELEAVQAELEAANNPNQGQLGV